ncbi:unnamed protein product [Spirodela intermedia]|uniref:Protein kinase domain-containing protein n=1 Tax=Spirodela intermedia TaxID=51605 RepID=A0A7I8J512_SPIIN|nr:unnamed protein product [Spirodela intermedia]CAA6665326.1 unnamed protein product [Spirodela intermedia]
MGLQACCVFCGALPRRRRRRRRNDGENKERAKDRSELSPSNWNLFIRLKTLEAATDCFSDKNRLGQGGFGPVYKLIAVKKLSFNSRQGLKEFINEVKLLLKIQHRNLVSLFGCCTEAGEKMVIYEFLPNCSLDRILFDKSKSSNLLWSERFEIIKGIAKDLLYLHEESPVKVIHRDIKASNILLDAKLNPKISDFGLARLFENDETHVSTFKISGTYGYMAPEYAFHGYLSVKTDVFSFGVLVLEILSGRRNLDRYLRQTWRLSEEGKPLEMMDPSLAEWDSQEASLCIQVGLLCCQVVAADQPDMGSADLMLLSEFSALPRIGWPGVRGRVGKWRTTPSSSMSKMTNTSGMPTSSSEGPPQGPAP